MGSREVTRRGELPGVARRCAMLLMVAGSWAFPAHADTVASLLGNFTINQYCGLTVAATTVTVHYVVVYGQLPAIQELHAADANGDGVTSEAERNAYVGTLAPQFTDDLQLRVDGVRVPLQAGRWSSSLPTETGGFSLRVDMDFSAALPAGPRHVIQFSNRNYAGRMGWHEVVVTAAKPAAVFDTDGFSTSITGGLTEALQSLPEGGPLDERTVHLTMDANGLPDDGHPLGPRSGTSAVTAAPAAADGPESGWLMRRTRELVDAISAPQLKPSVVLLTLLAALLLGGVHALSPGHGKTIVGAYLIGSRGTPRHAVFLGLTVTATHTVGVFLLGFATLYASRFIVPERMFPILSLLSALLVLGMGMVLLIQRGRMARRAWLQHTAPHRLIFMPVHVAHAHERGLLRAPGALGDPYAHRHSHGGAMHSHRPPGAAGEQVTWKSLLALGISGGLVPCPSAMVLLLAAIALNKTAYGMLLVLVFSVGLALTLTAVGLLFLYARSRLLPSGATKRWTELLPLMSASFITVVGLALCVGAWRSFA
jgi:nickel/cobalt transporter (NicO) family protein